VLNRAFIQAAFIFMIGGIFFIVSQSVTIHGAMAQTQPANQMSGGGTGTEQQPLHQTQPIGPSRPVQQMGMQRPLQLKASPETKNEIIERRSEQIKREDFSRNLERRRQQLRQERRAARGRVAH
jgi:hypothetical protein